MENSSDQGYKEVKRRHGESQEIAKNRTGARREEDLDTSRATSAARDRAGTGDETSVERHAAGRPAPAPPPSFAAHELASRLNGEERTGQPMEA